ncbi:Pycsar system effector family protein [Streptosporangium sp. NPDC000396]|uniref:Pycsar system effector family protein n=1 Tax=Streptosporangium sp. NPDC000396 TaxID=3366185 RepID=UPI00367704D9
MLKIVRDTLPGRASSGDSPGDPARQERDGTLAYIAETLADVREEIFRADRKAVALMAAAVFGGLLAGRLRPQELPGQVEWLWWAGVFFCVMAIVVLAGAVYPRIVRLAGRAVERRRFYSVRAHAPSPRADVPRPEDSRAGAFADSALADLRARMASQDTRVRADRLVLRIRKLSSIAAAKDRYIRRGTLLLLISVVCCLLSVVIGQVMTSWDLFGRPMAPAVHRTQAPRSALMLDPRDHIRRSFTR